MERRVEWLLYLYIYFWSGREGTDNVRLKEEEVEGKIGRSAKIEFRKEFSSRKESRFHSMESKRG